MFKFIESFFSKKSLRKEPRRMRVGEKAILLENIVLNGASSVDELDIDGVVIFRRGQENFFSGEDKYYLMSVLLSRQEFQCFFPEQKSSKLYSLDQSIISENSPSIPEDILNLDFSGRPEAAALEFFSKDGWSGVHSEGIVIREIFRAILLPYFISKNPFKSIDPINTPLLHTLTYLIPMIIDGVLPSDTPSNRQELIDEMHREIDYMLSLPISITQSYFDVITLSQYDAFNKSKADYVAIDKYLSAIPNDFWHNLLEVYATGKGYLNHGWPDLEMTNGKELSLIEVKVKDRLTKNQRVTIPILIKLGLTCKIVRLKRKS